MTEEELKNTNDNELIMLYREEDEDAKNILFYKYRFIIDILIKKHLKYLTSLNIDYQEIYSECTVGFSDGLRSYQEDKSASLATFITLCIERRLGNIIRKYNRDKYKALQDTFSLDYIYSEKDTRLMDLLSDDYEHDPLKNITEQEGYLELVNSIKDKLTEKEYEVFVLMVRGLSYIEIAKILNNTPKQIDNTIQRVKSKIRNIINEKEECNI